MLSRPSSGSSQSITGIENPDFGRLEGEPASGHWLYAFLRIQRDGPEAYLVVTNLHGSETLRGVRVRLAEGHLQATGHPTGTVHFRDRLATAWTGSAPAAELPTRGLPLPDLPPLSALYLEIR